MDDMDEYKEMFAVESAEHLQSMNEALLSLEKDPGNKETINVMFRAAHTLKGMSATMGYVNIKELTHNMENLMDSVRKNEIMLNSSAIDTLFECLDILEKMVEMPEKSGELDISSLIDKISLLSKNNPESVPLKTDQTVSTENMVHEAISNDTPADVTESDNSNKKSGTANIYEITVTLHESCMLKSARSTVVMRNLSELGEIIETHPPVKDLEDEKFDHEFKVIVSTMEDAKKLEEGAKKVSEISKVEVKPYLGSKSKVKIDEKTGVTEGSKTSIKSVQSVRVSIERLDSLMNLVGELIINKIRLMQLASVHKLDDLEETLASLNRLTNDLQEEIMASRMVPIEQIFNRFPRMVRDLSKNEGKDIDLILEGGDIELDRTVLDEIGDPLVHILRNCVDHGIELPQFRKENGKNPKGTIKLTARREKNHVVIEAIDDGKGIDPQKMRETAVKKGLMTQEEAEKISDTEAINLSFMPGFSTAEKITDISGRGVGMDVVRTKIGGMGGSLKLESFRGKGTTMRLKLPLTVAIIHSLMVKVGVDIFAIPIANVIRDLSIRKEEIKTIKGEEVVLIRGEVLPLVRLHKLFDIKSNGSQELLVVVVERAGSNVGLVVDQVIGQQEVIIKNLDNNILKGIKGFAGATILGDGNVALILDVGTLL
jgi:two-component system chemotaxis sensor kinase CheA